MFERHKSENRDNRERQKRERRKSLPKFFFPFFVPGMILFTLPLSSSLEGLLPSCQKECQKFPWTWTLAMPTFPSTFQLLYASTGRTLSVNIVWREAASNISRVPVTLLERSWTLNLKREPLKSISRHHQPPSTPSKAKTKSVKREIACPENSSFVNRDLSLQLVNWGFRGTQGSLCQSILSAG